MNFLLVIRIKSWRIEVARNSQLSYTWSVTQWEYNIQILPSTKWEDRLIYYGQNGWELCGYDFIPLQGWRFVFKRPIQNPKE